MVGSMSWCVEQLHCCHLQWAAGHVRWAHRQSGRMGTPQKEESRGKPPVVHADVVVAERGERGRYATDGAALVQHRLHRGAHRGVRDDVAAGEGRVRAVLAGVAVPRPPPLRRCQREPVVQGRGEAQPHREEEQEEEGIGHGH